MRSDETTGSGLIRPGDAPSFSIEENRRGEVDIHLDLEKDIANFRFNPRATFQSEAMEGS